MQTPSNTKVREPFVAKAHPQDWHLSFRSGELTGNSPQCLCFVFSQLEKQFFVIKKANSETKY